MKLDAFFGAIAPYLEGRRGHAETVAALYGEAAATTHALDAERLAIYERFCRLHRFEAVGLFAETRAAIVAAAGEPAWQRLVEDFFLAHPMHHFELNENAAALPAWLAGPAGAGRLAPLAPLPPWITELADLEWAAFCADLGPEPDPDDTAEPGGGRGLRIAPSVDVRPYQHDLVAWLDAEGPRPAAPAPRPSLVIFWRDRDLDGRREPADPAELVVLKMVAERLPAAEVVAQSGLSGDRLFRTLADLHRAGILVGPPA